MVHSNLFLRMLILGKPNLWGLIKYIIYSCVKYLLIHCVECSVIPHSTASTYKMRNNCYSVEGMFILNQSIIHNALPIYFSDIIYFVTTPHETVFYINISIVRRTVTTFFFQCCEIHNQAGWNMHVENGIMQ